MRKLKVFNNVSLDGYFVDQKGDMTWAHKDDPEWMAFISENASGGGTLVFGRITYQQMERFWPTEQAFKTMPVVAERMTSLEKVVFSRTLDRVTWKNTRLVKTDPVGEIRRMKQESGPDLVIMGSGTIIAPLAQAHLIDSYQMVVNSLILGAGRTMFEGLKDRLNLTLKHSRPFENGNIVLTYEALPAR